MDWDQAKEKYQNVEIPEQLDKIVNQAIQESREAVQMKTTEFETQQIDEKNGVIKMKKKKLHKKFGLQSVAWRLLLLLYLLLV